MRIECTYSQSRAIRTRIATHAFVHGRSLILGSVYLYGNVLQASAAPDTHYNRALAVVNLLILTKNRMLVLKTRIRKLDPRARDNPENTSSRGVVFQNSKCLIYLTTNDSLEVRRA